MNRRLSFIIGGVFAGLLTFGFVSAGCRMDPGAAGYQAFFQSTILFIESLWSKAHGWQPLSHIRNFGPWFAKAVHLGCPILGYAVFALFGRLRTRLTVWKPLGIAALCTGLYALILPHGFPLSVLWLPWAEAAFVMSVFSLMIWSSGVLPAITPSPPNHRIDSLTL